MTFCPAVLNRRILPFDVARFLQSLAERGHVRRKSFRDVLLRNPITGIAGCARATHGHTAAPLIRLMNSRRRMAPPPAWDDGPGRMTITHSEPRPAYRLRHVLRLLRRDRLPVALSHALARAFVGRAKYWSG
jgi:hypothetical protein